MPANVARYLRPKSWPTNALVKGTVASHRNPIQKQNTNTDVTEIGTMTNIAITIERRK